MTLKEQHQATAGTEAIVGGVDIEALNALPDNKAIHKIEKAIDKLLKDKNFTPAEKAHTLKILAQLMAQKNFSDDIEELKKEYAYSWKMDLDFHPENAEEVFRANMIQGGHYRLPSELLSHWAHEACHLLEDYGFELKPHPFGLSEKDIGPNSYNTLLGAPDFYPAAKILINETVRRLEALSGNGRIINTSRIFTPTALMNIDGLAEIPHLNTWRFMPASLNCEAVLGRVNDIEKAMFSSATPEEFYNKLVACDTVYKPHRYENETIEKLRQFIIARGGETAVPVNFLQDTSPKETILNIVAYDVDGTLLDAQGNLQEHVYNQMIAESTACEKVKIYTGGNIEDATNRMNEAIKRAGRNGSIDHRGIHPKSDLEKDGGATVKKLVDNTPPHLQGFRAIEWVHPDQLRPTKISVPEPKQP